MTSSKRCVHIKVAAALLAMGFYLFASLSAYAVTRVWKGEGTGTTVATASDFGDASHWFNGVPEAQDGCYFTNCPANVWNFIKADSRYTLASFNARHWESPENPRNVVFVSDSGVAFSTSSDHTLVLSPHIYADVYAASKFMSWELNLCGDFESTVSASQAQYTHASNTLRHRLDRYANSPGGGVRLNPMAVDSFHHGAGTYAIYAPKGTNELTVSQWNQTEGSPYLFPVSGNATDYPVGASVTGDGIAPGTFLKRIFPDGSIEISSPVEAGKTKSANELTLGTLSSVVTQRFELVNYTGNSGNRTISLNKYRDEDELVLRIGSFASGTSPNVVLSTNSGFKPGKVIMENTDGLKAGAKVVLHTCRLEFEGNNGFAKQTVTLPASGEQAVVEVAEGGSAYLGASAKSLVGTLVKEGGGELVLAMTNAPSANTGTLHVAAGSVRLLAAEDAKAQVGQLALADGARVVLDGGEVEALGLAVEGTATLSGSGTLVVPVGSDISGLRFEDGANVRFGGAQVLVNWTSPGSGVVGCPALWVDASKEETITAENGRVSRIDDVRGSEHFYATASSANANMRPELVNVCGLAYLEFSSTVDSSFATTDPAHYGALVWNRQITGIRAVFLVHDTYNGGGEVLGLTTGMSDFARPHGLDWTYLVIWSGAAECVKEAACYVNGEKRNFRASGAYPYRGGTYTGNYGTERWLPNVTEVHPVAPGAKADCWGMDPGTDQHGLIRLCECLVYTNVLTEAERQSVANYLSRKWVGREISYERYVGAGVDEVDVSASPSFAVAAGESMAVKTVTGTGTLGKEGDGTLSLLGCGDGNASLVVSGGRLVVGSGLDETAIPDGAYLHLDASKDGTVVTDVKNGREYVKSWKDVRADSGMSADSISATTNAPAVKVVAALQNRPVVDFGPWSGVSYVAYTSPELDFKRDGVDELVSSTPGLRTEIVVLGSAQGGGELISGGMYHGYTEDYGVTRKGGSYANPLIRTDGDLTGKQTTYTHSFCEGENAAIRRNDIRVNGTPVLGTDENVLSGTYDLVTFSVYDAFGARCFGAHHWGWYNGGNEMGEVLLYREQLSPYTIDRIEAYLGKKWFGRDSVEYPSARVASVHVAAGAELELKGGDPLTTAALSGTGSIDGDVALASGGVLNVYVAGGVVPTLTVTGEVSGDGTVVLTGNLTDLEEGDYMVLQSSGLSGNWTEDGGGARSRLAYRIVKKDDSLFLRMSRNGVMIFVR